MRDRTTSCCADGTTMSQMPLAISYVPMQKFVNVVNAADGFRMGTIFKDLDLDFHCTSCMDCQKDGCMRSRNAVRTSCSNYMSNSSCMSSRGSNMQNNSYMSSRGSNMQNNPCMSSRGSNMQNNSCPNSYRSNMQNSCESSCDCGMKRTSCHMNRQNCQQ